MSFLMAASTTAKARVIEYAEFGGGDPVFSFNVVAIPFVGSGTEPAVTFQADIGTWSTLLTVPTLDELGIDGRLDTIRFSAGNILADVHLMQEFLVTGDPLDNMWATHGLYSLSGKMGIRVDGSLIGSAPFSFSYFAGCDGTLSNECTHDFSQIAAEMDNPDYIFAALEDDERPNIEWVLNDLKVIGSISADLGDFDGGEYSGEWKLNGGVIGSYEYTEVSQVPLPAGGWLFLCAVTGLVFVASRKTAIAKLRGLFSRRPAVGF